MERKTDISLILVLPMALIETIHSCWKKRFHWHGVCIEANPLLFRILKRFRNVTCLNICSDAKEGLVDFVLRGELSGIVDSNLDNTRKNIDIKQANIIKLKTSTLISILKEGKAPNVIDYLSLDVEGAEDRVLCGFPFEQYIFNCITVERPKPELISVLKKMVI